VGGIEALAVKGLEEHHRRATAAKHAVAYKPAFVEAALAPDALVVLGRGAEGLVDAPPGFVQVPSTAEAELATPPQTKAVFEAQDITDPKAYSIEDSKRKTEEDRRHAEAEAKKAFVLKQVAELQAEFAALHAKNASRPVLERLTDEELLVDPEYAAILAEEGEAMVDEVYKECAYATEKSERRLEKLEERFLDPVETEAAELDSFDLSKTPILGTGPSSSVVGGSGGGGGAAMLLGSPISPGRTGGGGGSNLGAAAEVPFSVRSFVVPVVDGAFGQLLAETKEKMRKEEEARMNEERAERGTLVSREAKRSAGGGASVAGSLNGGGAGGGLDEGVGGLSLVDGTATEGGTEHGEEKPHSMDMVRLERRRERHEAMAAMVARKPGKDDDDPIDTSRIAEAERTMGDYRLKSSPGYTVPEGTLVNAALKLRELVRINVNLPIKRVAFHVHSVASAVQAVVSVQLL